MHMAYTGLRQATVVLDGNNQTVGTDARLLCRVEDAHGGEDITVQWRKDGQLIDSDDDEDRYTLEGPRLIIEKVIGQDAGQYTCMARRGDEQVTSPTVTLNILREYRPQSHCHPITNKLRGRPSQYVPAPAPCKFTFDLLTLKVVSESRVTWAIIPLC